MASNPKKEDTFEDLGFVKDEGGSYHFNELEIAPVPIPELSSDGPVSRLVITHLVATNFKSYAGKQRIGPFDRNFTAVVGPNGSGKSNVIDALMFVFGKKAKDIRGKNMLALIHKSEKYPNVKSCSVAVNFARVVEQNDEIEVVKGAGLVVTRYIIDDGGNGTGYYEINRKRALHKDVVITLRKYGIDMEYNRFLIMQGEIESISLMPPKATPKESVGMLEYIEDIVGSHRLIEPIQYFQRKIDELSAQESEKGKEVDLFEKEKNELEEPKNRAIAYLRLENKRALCENSVLHAQRSKAEKELEDITQAKNEFMEEVKSLKAEMAKVQESKKALESDLAKLAAKHDSILKKRDEYDGEFRALIRQDAANLEDIKHIKGKIQNAKKGMEDSQSEIKKLTKQLTVYETETNELQIKKKKLEEEKAVEEKKATRVMGTLKEETEKMQEKKDVKEAELIKLKENMYQIKSEMDLIKSELSICVSGEKKEKEKLSSLQLNYKNNQDSAKQEEALVLEEASQVKELEKELSSLKEQLSEAKEKELSLFQQNRDARQKWEEARHSQQSSRNNSSLLQALFKAKSAGKLPAGIYGRLGNLGAIDEKYDVAISTCCGRLDNIVTDTITTAQQCVAYMKRHNLGYATFIALDQMSRYEQVVHQKVNTPENIPRLFDLIRVKNAAMLPAFYFAVQETLVANNLEQATRIGLGGHIRRRVVTLDGKLVEATGAMIGGGNQVIRGKMGQQVVENTHSDQELADMSARVNALQRELSEVKQLCMSLDEKIAQTTNQLSSLQHSLKKRSQRCNAFKGQIEMMSSQIKEQEKKMKGLIVDEEKVSKLEEQIQSKNKIYTKAVQETSVVEKEVSELQEKILEVTKGKYSKAKKTVDQLKKKLDEVTQAITKSTVNMKQSRTKVKKLEAKLNTLQTDLVANEKELQILKEKQNDLTDKGHKTSELVKQHNEELEEYIEKQKHLKKEMETINKKEHEKKRVEIEQKNIMKTHEASESEKRAYIRSIKSKLGKLKLTEVENDSTEIPSLSDEDISKLNLQNLLKELDIMKVQLEDMEPDLSSIELFKKREQLFQSKWKEHSEIKAERLLHDRRKQILYKQRVTEFMKAFVTITVKVKEIYQMLTSGGDAELELVNRRDPFEGGIAFSVRPPKKAWKSMNHLSGGEKTLSSLALVFALHYYRATPFYVMDEIDAALDETNVGIIGKYLLVHQKNAQFIIVSLRNVMNELPDHLLGVHKINNCTHNIHLSNCLKWKGTRRTDRDAEPPSEAPH